MRTVETIRISTEGSFASGAWAFNGAIGMQQMETSKRAERKDDATVKLLKVAIDGPAGAGKSTVAQLVAKELDLLYIDTGAMYRAATWLALKNGIATTDGDAITKAASAAAIKLEPGDESTKFRTRVYVDNEEITHAIRTHEISDLVPHISEFSSLRKLMVARQKEMISKGGVVLDGRDIGTVVMPDADIKIYLTASADVRAKRRLKDQQALGENPNFEELVKSIAERDHRDSNRADSPLRQADDAIALITDNMSIEQVVEAVVRLCVEK
jgi:cytidylate kinase